MSRPAGRDVRVDHPHLPFATAPYDRHAERRANPDWWDRLAADAGARVLVVGDDRVATTGDRLLELTPQEAADLIEQATSTASAAAELFLLGEGARGAVAAVSLPELPEAVTPRPVRAVAPGLDPLQGSLLVHALGLANWHRTHPHCARCGQRTVSEQAGHLRRCRDCGGQHFPRTDPAVIMLITDAQDRALLGHSPHWPEGRYSTLAGFVEPGESLEDAVRREVAEETGVVVGEVAYAASQPWPFPSSLMVGFVGTAETSTIVVDGDEVSDAQWFSRSDLEAAAAAGKMLLPGEFSISRWLIDRWHGGALPGRW